MGRHTTGIRCRYIHGFGRVVLFSSGDSRRSARPREADVHTDRNFKDLSKIYYRSLLEGQAPWAPCAARACQPKRTQSPRPAVLRSFRLAVNVFSRSTGLFTLDATAMFPQVAQRVFESHSIHRLLSVAPSHCTRRRANPPGRGTTKQFWIPFCGGAL